MNESILDDSVILEEVLENDTEVSASDTEYGADVIEFDCDNLDSISGSDDVEAVELEDGTTVYYVDSTMSLDGLIDEDLGGVPVVLTNDVSVVSDYVGVGGSSYQLSSYYVDYFAGVLANMFDTDYVAFAYRDYYSSSTYNYTEHYLLVYDIVVSDDIAVADTYPCIDISRDSSSSTYSVVSGTYALSSVPAFSYGSFGTLSDLRKGVSHNETWMLLFAVGFAVVYSVCTHFFDFVSRLRRRTS